MTSKEWKILGAYAEKHQLRPQLSHPAMGQFYFKNRKDQEIKASMLTMRHEIEKDQEQAKQARKRRQM